MTGGGRVLYNMKRTQNDQYILTERSVKKTQKNADTWYYVGYIGEIGFAIAIPIAGGALLGAYVDKLFLTYPKATLSLLFLGIAVSIVGFIRTIQEIIKD